MYYQEYIRGREREYCTPYYCVQTPFVKYRGQIVQYCTHSVQSIPQMSGLITTTTVTSCSLALQGWCCGHTPECATQRRTQGGGVRSNPPFGGLYIRYLLSLSVWHPQDVLNIECHYFVYHALPNNAHRMIQSYYTLIQYLT
jgi:hypothetical protein